MASFTLQTQMNYRSNELTAVIVGTSDSSLNYSGQTEVSYYLVKTAETSNVHTTIFQTVVEATAQNEESIPLGNAYENNTSYNITAIALDTNYEAIANNTLTETVTFFDAPGTPALEDLVLSSQSGYLVATINGVNAMDITGAAVTHFFVEGFQRTGGSATFSKTVQRTSGDSTNLIVANDGTYNSFANGQQWTVNVTAFNVAGSSGPVTQTGLISATPNAMALTVVQPLSSGPSVPSFSFAAVDSNPINGEDITSLSLTISQDGVADQVLNLLSLYDQSNNRLSAVTIEHGASVGGVNSIVLTAGNEISLSFIAANSQGSGAAQTTFTYNGAANTSSFIAQSEVTFKSLLTAARLAGAIVSRDIVNDNEITVNLNSSTDLSGNALTDLYNANGTSVALTLSVVDPNSSNAEVAAAQTLNTLDQTLTFDISLNGTAKWNSIALLLTATSTYDAQSDSSIQQVSDSINLINDLLTMSVSAVQPAKGATTLTGTLTVDPTTDNKPAFVSGTARLFLDKNNTGETVDLNLMGPGDAMQVSPVTISSLDSNNQATITFSGLHANHDGHGLHIVVDASQNASNADTHAFAQADTSSTKRFKFSDPVLSYSAGDSTATITSNGYTLTSAVSLDLTSGEQELVIVYNDNSDVDPADVSNNDGFNVKFRDPANNNNKDEITIDISGIDATAETLLTFLNQANVADQGVHKVGGQSNL